MNILTIKPIQKTKGKLILIFLTLLSVSSVKAASTYTFTSGEIVLDHFSPDSIDYFPENPRSRRFTSSLTFANPLAANSTTTIKAESGSAQFGFNFFGANTGGVTDYSSNVNNPGGFTESILGDIFAVSDGRPIDDGLLFLNQYSTVFGEVSTDNIGNIVDWVLEYTLYTITNGSVRVAPAITDPSFNGINPNLSSELRDSVRITSGDTRNFNLRADNFILRNGIEGLGGVFNEPLQDQSINHPLNVASYTNEVGSFAPPVTTVPEPTTLMLFLVVGFTWVTNQLRVKKAIHFIT